MRIGIVSLHTSPSQKPGQGDAGGMNVVVSEAALALHALGHEVTIATRATSDLPPGRSPLNHIDGPALIAIEAGSPLLPKNDLLSVIPEFHAGLSELPEFTLADVIHSHYWLSGIAADSLIKSHKITHVTTLHTVGAQKNEYLRPGDTPEPKVRIDGERYLTQNAFVVAGSQSELRGVHDGYGTPPIGSAVIHPGVDTALFAPRSLDSQSVASRPFRRITVLGRVQPLKGQDLALEAFACFVQQHPLLAHDVTLTIAGEATPSQEAFLETLRHRAVGLGLSVEFLPAQSRAEAAGLLADSDLVLVPSHSETFGLVALEAAACGTPVIAAHTTGLIEAVSEGQSGTLITGRDPRDWAAAIANVAANPLYRARFSIEARRHALQQSWSQHARSLELLYRSL